METNTLQLHLHYYFDDKERHSLEAFTRNENEKDLLLVLKKTCELFRLTGIVIEIVPAEEGGFKERLKLIFNTSLVIGGFAVGAFTAYWTMKSAQSQIKVNEIEYKLKEIELREKLKQIKEDSISKAKQKQLEKEIVTIAVDTLSSDHKSRYHRSQFYDRTYKVGTIIEKVSTQVLDKRSRPFQIEKIVERSAFKDFILKTDAIAPLIDNNAIIRIISPVVDGGAKYKWKGWYNNEEINFTMSDLKFRQNIQLGKVEFTGGSTIECVLQIKRKIDGSTGEVRKGKKNVLRVKAHILNDIRTEFTHKRKLKHEMQPASGAQLNFFGPK